MSKYNSQINRVKRKLNKDGFVTRNECLSQYPAITRLGAIICVLRDEGYEFDTKDTKKDYVYTWTNKKVWKSFEVNGQMVARRVVEPMEQGKLL